MELRPAPERSNSALRMSDELQDQPVDPCGTPRPSRCCTSCQTCRSMRPGRAASQSASSPSTAIAARARAGCPRTTRRACRSEPLRRDVPQRAERARDARCDAARGSPARAAVPCWRMRSASAPLADARQRRVDQRRQRRTPAASAPCCQHQREVVAQRGEVAVARKQRRTQVRPSTASRPRSAAGRSDKRRPALGVGWHWRPSSCCLVRTGLRRRVGGLRPDGVLVEFGVAARPGSTAGVRSLSQRSQLLVAGHLRVAVQDADRDQIVVADAISRARSMFDGSCSSWFL